MASHGIPVIQDDFAPVSWDLSGDSLPEISIGNQTRYRSTVTNILSKHCTEVKLLSEEAVSTTSHLSKKKLKELIAKHNNELFSFMAQPDRPQQVLDRAEEILRKYEREQLASLRMQQKDPLADLNLNRSLDQAYQELDEGVRKLKGDGSLEDIQQQIRWLLNQYRTIGEEVLRLETILFQKMDMLDKLNQRLPLITTLADSPALTELIDSFTKYAKTIYDSSQFEETYINLVEQYKKWSICRQMLTVHQMMRQDAADPQCSICLLEPVACALVPCGHTFCGSCTKKQNTSCYICRSAIRERIRLYFT